VAHSKRFGGAVRVITLGLVVAMGAGWFVVGRQKGLIPPIRDALRTRMGVGNGKASAVWTHLRADGTSSLTALIGSDKPGPEPDAWYGTTSRVRSRTTEPG
jgi:hypothetical protein